MPIMECQFCKKKTVRFFQTMYFGTLITYCFNTECINKACEVIEKISEEKELELTDIPHE